MYVYSDVHRDRFVCMFRLFLSIIIFCSIISIMDYTHLMIQCSLFIHCTWKLLHVYTHAKVQVCVLHRYILH